MKVTPAAVQAAANGDLKNLIAATTSGGIEAQEAAGQKSFVASQTLPKDCPREDLETLGFVFGEDADDIFINVLFPEGWEIKATDHDMHNNLIDERGRRRGEIFYKAAFYDRSAHMRLIHRYSVDRDWKLKDVVQYVIKDCGEIIYRTEKVKCEGYSDDYYETQDVLEATAKNHLDNIFPKWKNNMAYWGRY